MKNAYRNAKELEDAVEKAFLEAKESFQIPTIRWIEYKTGAKLSKYAEKKGFDKIVMHTRERSIAECEQIALLGGMTREASGLFLKRYCDYAIPKEINVNTEGTVDVSAFVNVMDEIKSRLNEKEKEEYANTLIEALKDAEEGEA